MLWKSYAWTSKIASKWTLFHSFFPENLKKFLCILIIMCGEIIIQISVSGFSDSPKLSSENEGCCILYMHEHWNRTQYKRDSSGKRPLLCALWFLQGSLKFLCLFLSPWTLALVFSELLASMWLSWLRPTPHSDLLAPVPIWSVSLA